MDSITTLNQLSVLTLHVGLAQLNGNWNWKNVRSPFARLYYVTEGEAQIQLPTGTYTLRPHHLYLIPPFTTHNNICTGTFSHYYIHIYEAHEQYSLFDNWDFPTETEARAEDQTLLQRLCDISPCLRLPQYSPETYDNRQTLTDSLRINNLRPFHNSMEARGILLVLLSRFLTQAKPKTEASDSRIQKTINYIRTHLGDTLSLDTLAPMACMSKDHYIRLFRQATRQTPTNYVSIRRMEKAELLLATTDMPVKQVAHEVGYGDTSYFNRIFHKHTGLSPQAYRQRINILIPPK